MKNALLIGLMALVTAGVEVQAQGVSVQDNSSVRTENTADALRRGGGRRGGRGGRDWDRGGRRGGRDWDRGRRGGRFWPNPGGRWDNDQYVCHARGNRSRVLYRGDAWTRSSARSEALNRCYRSNGSCYITSCYRD